MILFENMTREQKLTYYQGQQDLLDLLSIRAASVTANVSSPRERVLAYMSFIKLIQAISKDLQTTKQELQEND